MCRASASDNFYEFRTCVECSNESACVWPLWCEKNDSGQHQTRTRADDCASVDGRISCFAFSDNALITYRVCLSSGHRGSLRIVLGVELVTYPALESNGGDDVEVSVRKTPPDGRRVPGPNGRPAPPPPPSTCTASAWSCAKRSRDESKTVSAAWVRT